VVMTAVGNDGTGWCNSHSCNTKFHLESGADNSAVCGFQQ
jgi:hypothetical protein